MTRPSFRVWLSSRKPKGNPAQTALATAVRGPDARIANEAQITIDNSYFNDLVTPNIINPFADINGDGCDEILMAGKKYDETWETRIWLGQPDMPVPMTARAAEAQITIVGGEFVDRVLSIPDINEDGIGDLMG